MSKILFFKKFDVVNKSNSSAELIIYDIIGIDWWTGEGVTAKTVQKALGEIPTSVDELNIRINSPGGSVFDGVAIYNLIKNSRFKKKKVYIDALAASAASVIAMAGDEIIMMEASLMMIHQASVGSYGNADQLQNIVDELRLIDDQITSIYAKKTKKERFEVSTLLKKNGPDGYWMDGAKAIEEGFATSVISKKDDDDEKTMRAVAHWNPEASKNMPWMKMAPKMATQKDVVSGKAKSLKQNIESFLAHRK